MGIWEDNLMIHLVLKIKIKYKYSLIIPNCIIELFLLHQMTRVT